MWEARQILKLASIAAVLLFMSFMLACSHEYGYGYYGNGYLVYDPYWGDYHIWGPDEFGYYRDFDRDHHFHRDYGRLDRDDQRQYWQWRHNSSNPPAPAPHIPAPPRPEPPPPQPPHH